MSILICFFFPGKADGVWKFHSVTDASTPTTVMCFKHSTDDPMYLFSWPILKITNLQTQTKNDHVLQMVTEHSEVDSEGQMQLPDDDEEDLCRVWDMAMDKVQFLMSQELHILIDLPELFMNIVNSKVWMIFTTQLKKKKKIV